jgi:hypothetical protein
MTKVEMLPIPAEHVDKFWRGVCLTALRKIPGYDMHRTHQRLLVGLDQLWVACSPYVGSRVIWGVCITTISERPPSARKCFQRDDPALMRSLTIHMAGQWYPYKWMDSAIERITAYALEHKCRQLFLSTRKNWQRRINRRFFYAAKWEGVAITRDRPTKSTCRQFQLRNTPGHYRPMVPVKNFTRHMYGYMCTFYFQDQEAAA